MTSLIHRFSMSDTPKNKELIKTYHTSSDIAGGMDLACSLELNKLFHPLHHSHDKFYQAPSCNVEKLGEA